jgi:hypothetical protein
MVKNAIMSHNSEYTKNVEDMFDAVSRDSAINTGKFQEKDLLNMIKAHNILRGKLPAS